MRLLTSLATAIALTAGTLGPATGADPVTTTPAATLPKPNIVMLLLDDINPHDGRLWQYLPTIRHEFVERGIEFTDFHGETPTCCPGRAGFLTGLHTDAHGVTRNLGRLLRPSMTIATQLRRSGYYNIYGGKYLNGYDTIPDKVPPGWQQFHGMSGDYYGYPMWSNGRREYHGSKPRDYSTDVTRRKVMASLRSAPRKKRVFVVMSPWAAHVPRKPAPRHKDSTACDGIPPWKPPNYMEKNVRDKPAYIRKLRLRQPAGFNLRKLCRPLLAVDEMLAAVVRELKRQGRYGNTLLILTADNGMNFGAHRMLEDKKTPFATQLPFYVAWPNLPDTAPERVTERLQNIDLAPTLCVLARCSLGPYPTGQRKPDGKSFAGLLMGTRKALRRPVVLTSFRTRGARKVPRWYAITTTRHSDLAGRRCELAAQNGCRWTLVLYENGAKELYDLSNGPCHLWERGQTGDPCRLQNLANRKGYGGIKSELRRILKAKVAASKK